MENMPLASARSYLFVPADRIERLSKALATEADVIVVDLEDAVAPSAKARARDALASADLPQPRVAVRINGAGTDWCAQDIQTVQALGVTTVMLPKAEGAADIAAIAEALGPQVSLVALVESATGVWNVLEVARAPRVARLAFGAIDFALDATTSLDDAALAYARSRLVLASRIAKLPPPIDCASTLTDDPAAVEAEARIGQRLGFGAKLCIHPKQVDIVNRVHTPSDEEIGWAQEVLAAARASGGAAVQVAGRMVDLPVIKRAERIASFRPATMGRLTTPSQRQEP